MRHVSKFRGFVSPCIWCRQAHTSIQKGRHVGGGISPSGQFFFQAAYCTGMHTAQGRYPAAIAAASSAKNTRCAT
ncbi:hypothetical protein LMG26411_03128 [Cupriavidus numazuensis]|uniref:Uncharacterized protein n=1 Tax=Cupriavidus numazuensis TaxID=221992 RepID=A0ABM8THW0_9BURK|nr:hypothetical protein LMG26411_03128 [Cupriavidus numazuensis]